MTDYILADGETQDLVLTAGDTALVGAGITFFGRLTADALSGDPILVTVEGTMDVDVSDYPDPYEYGAIELYLQDPLATGHSVIIAETGAIVARRGIWVSGGTGAHVENHGTITDAPDDPAVTFGWGIAIESDGGSVWNTGLIEIDGAGPGNELSFGIRVVPSSDVTVRNDGVIVAETGIVATGSGHRILNTGLVTASDSAIAVNGEAGTIVNTGDLTGGFVAVFVDGTGHRIANFGTIVTEDLGGLNGPGPALVLAASDGLVLNQGTISSPESFGISAVGSNHTVINNGTISGGVAVGSGYTFPYDEATGEMTETWAPGEAFTLVNTGLIETMSASGPAVWIGDEGAFGDPDPVAGVTIANSGIILGSASASDAAIDVYGTGIEVFNSGHIGFQPGGDGTAVLLHGGDAVFRNAGTVGGDVTFGGGSDSYDGRGGSVDGLIRMGLGADTARGGSARDVILGGGGGDVLEGAGGSDILAGQAGADTLDGGRGDDLLLGGAGPDVFVFGLASGDDVIADAGAGDQFDLTELGAWTEADVLAEASDTAGGVLIDLTALGGDGSVLLAGLALSDLQGDWVV